MNDKKCDCRNECDCDGCYKSNGAWRIFIGIGIGIMFVFIGIAIALLILHTILPGIFVFLDRNWFGDLFLIFIIICTFSWCLKYPFLFWNKRRKLQRGNMDSKELLKIKYANGEITKKEFEQKIKDINKY